MATTELATVVSSVTTGAKNIYDIATDLYYKRKQNKLITKGEMQHLAIQIEGTIECARATERHHLAKVVNDYLCDTFNDIHDPNSILGRKQLENFEREARSFYHYAESYDRITEQGTFKW